MYQKLELTTDGTCLGEFESRVRAKKSFTRHSRDIHATVARYSRDISVTFLLQHGDISACLVNELDMKEIVIISEKMASPWTRDQVLVKYDELRETHPALPQTLRPFQVNHQRLYFLYGKISIPMVVTCVKHIECTKIHR